MSTFYFDTINGKHPGAVVLLVMAIWMLAEFLRASVRWCERDEIILRAKTAVWCYRAIPLLMLAITYQQKEIVESLRETAVAKGIPETALPIAEIRHQQTGYHAVLNRPDGTTMTVDFRPSKEVTKWQIQ
jgi:hypothetical protein